MRDTSPKRPNSEGSAAAIAPITCHVISDKFRMDWRLAIAIGDAEGQFVHITAPRPAPHHLRDTVTPAHPIIPATLRRAAAWFIQTAREQRAGFDLNRMCLLFPSSPDGLPPRFTHRFRSGPAHSASSGQAIFALSGSVRSASPVVQKGSLHARPRVSHR